MMTSSIFSLPTGRDEAQIRALRGPHVLEKLGWKGQGSGAATMGVCPGSHLTTIFTGYTPTPRRRGLGTLYMIRPLLFVISVSRCTQRPEDGSAITRMSTCRQ